MKKKRNRENLSLKQEKLARILASGQAASKTQAMRDAGYSPNTIAAKLTSTVDNPNVQSRIKEIIGAGDFDEKALGTLKEILDIPMTNYDDATDLTSVARIKLDVIKEINKIQGNYAPTRIDSRMLKFQFKPPED